MQFLQFLTGILQLSFQLMGVYVFWWIMHTLFWVGKLNDSQRDEVPAFFRVFTRFMNQGNAVTRAFFDEDGQGNFQDPYATNFEQYENQ